MKGGSSRGSPPPVLKTQKTAENEGEGLARRTRRSRRRKGGGSRLDVDRVESSAQRSKLQSNKLPRIDGERNFSERGGGAIAFGYRI
jgi:hypothetical protein